MKLLIKRKLKSQFVCEYINIFFYFFYYFYVYHFILCISYALCLIDSEKYRLFLIGTAINISIIIITTIIL